LTSGEGAQALGERIRQSVEQMRVHYQGHAIQITVSLGFTVVDTDSLAGPDNLIHGAAVALAEAKARGRNCCIVRPMATNVASAAC
jgi:PleD family two-component response regulator